MSKIGIDITIDVTKIEKPRLFQGKKGKYLNMTLFLDTVNQSEYGDNGMVVHKKNKDEEGHTPILGNAKIFWTDHQSDGPIGLQSLAGVQSSPEVTQVENPHPDLDDDIPF